MSSLEKVYPSSIPTAATVVTTHPTLLLYATHKICNMFYLTLRDRFRLRRPQKVCKRIYMTRFHIFFFFHRPVPHDDSPIRTPPAGISGNCTDLCTAKIDIILCLDEGGIHRKELLRKLFTYKRALPLFFTNDIILNINT